MTDKHGPKNGPWIIRSRRIAYDNPWIKVAHHEVMRPDGKAGVYGVVHFAHLAVGVLPLFEDGTVPLVGQHRFPLDAYSWELPEGGGPLEEAPEAAARRELAEETGLTAKELYPLGECHLSNSVTDEKAVMFLAWGLSEGAAAPAGDEVLAHRRLSFSDLLQEVLDGKITDALTILLVQTALLKAKRGDLPAVPRALILGAVGE